MLCMIARALELGPLGLEVGHSMQLTTCVFRFKTIFKLVCATRIPIGSPAFLPLSLGLVGMGGGYSTVLQSHGPTDDCIHRDAAGDKCGLCAPCLTGMPGPVGSLEGVCTCQGAAGVSVGQCPDCSPGGMAGAVESAPIAGSLEGVCTCQGAAGVSVGQCPDCFPGGMAGAVEPAPIAGLPLHGGEPTAPWVALPVPGTVEELLIAAEQARTLSRASQIWEPFTPDSTVGGRRPIALDHLKRVVTDLVVGGCLPNIFEAQIQVSEDSARSAWQHVRRVQNDKKITSGKRCGSYRYPPAQTHAALFSCRYEFTHTLVVPDARALTTQEAGLDLLQLLRLERIRRASF